MLALEDSRCLPRRLILLIVVSIIALSLGTYYLSLWPPHIRAIDFATADTPGRSRALVPFEAHVISKCPDTRDALKLLILPVMQRVQRKVDFKLSYIGTPTADGGVECAHGPTECLGNIIELCARELYPDPKIHLGFIMCLAKDYEQIPDRSLIEDCALEHAIDFKRLNECATRDDGAHGLSLLHKSIERSEDLGIRVSCTIRLNNKIYCVRDGGKWRNCPNGASVNKLVAAIEELARSS